MSYSHSSIIAPTFTAIVLHHKNSVFIADLGLRRKLARIPGAVHCQSCQLTLHSRARRGARSGSAQSSPHHCGIPPTAPYQTTAAPGWSSCLPCPLGRTRYMLTSRCRPWIPMSPVCGWGATEALSPKTPADIVTRSRCCSSGLVQ